MKKHILWREKRLLHQRIRLGGNKRAEGMRKIEIKMELLFMQVSVARLLRKND